MAESTDQKSKDLTRVQGRPDKRMAFEYCGRGTDWTSGRCDCQTWRQRQSTVPRSHSQWFVKTNFGGEPCGEMAFPLGLFGNDFVGLKSVSYEKEMLSTNPFFFNLEAWPSLSACSFWPLMIFYLNNFGGLKVQTIGTRTYFTRMQVIYLDPECNLL